MIWIAWALAADKTAVCTSGSTQVVLDAHVYTDVKGVHGTVQPEGFRGGLPGGTVAELRYESAYGATFVILQLLQQGRMVARSTTWLGVPFDHGTNGSLDGPPASLPVGAITLDASVAGRAWSCNANFL